MGEPYSKSWKKRDHIEKLRAAREKANNTTCTASVPNTVTTGHKRTIGHSLDSDSFCKSLLKIKCIKNENQSMTIDVN